MNEQASAVNIPAELSKSGTLEKNILLAKGVKGLRLKPLPASDDKEDLTVVLDNDLLVIEKTTLGYTLTLSQKPSSGTLAWTSSNNSVATVNASGHVTPNEAGQAIITVTAGGNEDECRVYVINESIEGKTAIGKGIDITKAEMVTNDYLKWSNPVYDIDLLNAMGKWVESNVLSNTEKTEVAAGETVTETIKKFNSKNKVSASYPSVFSASVEANYSASNSEKRATGFIRLQTQIRTKDECIKGGVNLSILSQFVTDNFKKDLNEKTAAQILDAYGSHVIAKCFWGGVVQLDFISTSSKITNTSKLEIVVKASAYGVTADSSNTLESEKEEFSKNSTFKMERHGGNIIGVISVEDFEKGYSSWANSVKTAPVVCGIDAFNEQENMLPIWEIAKLINPAKSTQIENEFYKRINENGIALKGVDDGYLKWKTATIQTGRIMRDSPNTIVSRVRGDSEINSKSNQSTLWMLYLKLEPAGNPVNGAYRSVKLIYEYTVMEDKDDHTTLRIYGWKTFAVPRFTNKVNKEMTLGCLDEGHKENLGKIVGKNHTWICVISNKSDEFVHQLDIKIDGPGNDEGNIGFDVVLNINYLEPSNSTNLKDKLIVKNITK